ncbi:type II secretion system F family protein [Undibacterium sp. RTI2.1]|uniref:type II secretion system F family protein n=1 Tax=unclassified Undibacterium TaxID=2630295 RepID=UPI002AB58B25|nr:MULTISPECIES: type II secretion system F family protein [unclassified Undibacterium]MDY7539779.1 type II secretion system F family protein [Undibacterium sp. 5I1]MEB0029435.1 type II secretion system F family protein [Undibacterium sp. RTI2.1]MEB0115946.1 type II secretion system F family protein [Undibacterium sp. RTI2.2]MEB0232035.1 type II secretion system F family protein [Undibacterium sp. 10I3]MEB0256814.1 type II secretion system F family protein [Undibacterium sp. 5I1]
MPSLQLKPLSFAVRANLYTHLAAMEKAGLPTDKAYGLLELPAPAQSRVVAMRKLLARGKDIPVAGQQSGLFSDLEVHLLRAATSAGSPATMYRRLADTYTEKDRLSKAVKSRLKLPLMILGLSLLIQPLPALVAGSLTGGGYVWSVVRPFLAIGIGAVCFKKFHHWLQTASASPLRECIEKTLTKIPLFGAMHVRRNARDFFESLGLMLEAGLPMFEALPKAFKTISNQLIRADFARILASMQQGATLAYALENCIYIGNPQVISLVQTGEASGTLPEMLLRHAAMETASLSHFQQQAADWAPRIVYGAIMLWMAYSILQSKAFMPNVPKDLA